MRESEELTMVRPDGNSAISRIAINESKNQDSA